MKLKRTIKRKSKHRKKPGRNGKTMKRYMKKSGGKNDGQTGNESDDEDKIRTPINVDKILAPINKNEKRRREMRTQIEHDEMRMSADHLSDEKNNAGAYRYIIESYIERQKKNKKLDLEAVKFSLFKQKLQEIIEITNKYPEEEITPDELRKLKSIVFFIIKDDVSAYDMFFDEKAAGFQIWIDNFLRYLINDSPFENNVIIKIIEGIKKRPYVKTEVDKNYNYFISDVNNLFATIKQELTDKSNKEKPNAINKVIKQTKLKIKSDVEPVPEPGQDNGENNRENRDNMI